MSWLTRTYPGDDMPNWLFIVAVLPWALLVGVVLRPLAWLGVWPVRKLLDRAGEGW